MNRRVFARIGLGLAAGAAASTQAATAATEGKTHRVAIQVSSEDHKTQELALGNAHNYATYYQGRNEAFQIEIVAFGPGYNMMRSDISMVAGTIEALKKALGDHVAFSACQNTRAAIAASMGQTPDQVPQLAGVASTPSGIVRLAELQEQGWAYIRP